MTKTDKILLKTLLNIELELGRTQKIIEDNHLFFSLHIDFSHIYDLFEVIISSFPISDKDFDSLYNLLDDLYNHKISVDETIHHIELFIQ